MTPSDPLPFVSIIIPHHNGLHLLEPCLRSVLAIDYPASRYEVLVIDNASTDDSAAFVASTFPSVRWVTHTVNSFARALNVGAGLAVGDLLVFLNNDTVVDRQWLAALVGAVQQDRTIGACGSKILFRDGRLNSTGHCHSADWYWTDRGFGERDVGQYDAQQEVEGLSGCSLLIRREAWKAVGGVDERFVIYLEDVELCWRLREAGWRIRYVPESIVHHLFHGTSKEADVRWWVERNRLLILAKHHPAVLPEALMGRGYWQEQGRPPQRSLTYVLPEVFGVLWQHHPPEVAMPAMRGVLAQLGQRRPAHSRDDLERLYASQTYRLLVKPLWYALDAVKSWTAHGLLGLAAMTAPMLRPWVPPDSSLRRRARTLRFHLSDWLKEPA